MFVQRSTTLTGGEIMDSKKSFAPHVHEYVPLSPIQYAGDGTPKLLVACSCGSYRRVTAVDADAKKENEK
jgi:hypothetical protein